MSEKHSTIACNLACLLKEIDIHCAQAGRKTSQVSVVVVSKGQSLEKILEAYAYGCRDFGENRLNEALEKKVQAPGDIRWHFIGRIQKNKVSKLLGNFALLHSVDTPELARMIAEKSMQKGITTRILLQVNTSGEESKAGATMEIWRKAFLSLLEWQGIDICGLMTMAPLTQDFSLIRHCFSSLRHFRDLLQEEAKHHVDLSTLSMGMSGDYAIAIQEGSTLLRIGSAIFSPRMVSDES